METLRTACLLWLSLTLLVECDQLVLGERCGAVSVCLVGLYVAVKGNARCTRLGFALWRACRRGD